MKFDLEKLEKYEKQCKQIIEIADYLCYVFPVLYAVLLVTGTHPKSSFFILMPVIHLVWLVAYITIASRFDSEWKKQMTVFVLSTGLMALTLPYHMSGALRSGVGIRLPGGILFLFDLVITAGCVMLYFYLKNPIQKSLDKYIKWVQQQSCSSDSNIYDVVLCKDEETGEPVILDAKARYTHLFVNGPTGCGKTSLILTRMLEQDLKNGHGVICIEPKGDLAGKVYAMIQYYNRDGMFFDPTSPDCPYFNPLAGKEDEVIETMTTVFVMLAPDSITYFKTITINLLRKAIMTIKRIEAAHMNFETGISSRPATLIELNDLICNTNGKGVQMVNELVSIPTINESEAKQNQDTKSWFMNDYFSDRSKIYNDASGIRTQVANLIQNKYLRRVLNPENGVSDVNFDTILQEGKVLSISTALGELRDLGSYLGYFLIFTLQSSIFRRPGNENTRKPCFFYVDEANKYINGGFSDILTMGRSYRVAVTLASQSRELLASNVGRDTKDAFLTNISANLRSVILFPGICAEDAEYYSRALGEVTRQQVRTGETQQKFSAGSIFSGRYNPGTTSTQYSDVKEAEYSASDLTYNRFKTAIYRIMKNNEVQRARRGMFEWIDENLNDELDRITIEYNSRQQAKKEYADRQEQELRERLYRDYQKAHSGEKTAKPKNDGPVPLSQR